MTAITIAIPRAKMLAGMGGSFPLPDLVQASASLQPTLFFLIYLFMPAHADDTRIVRSDVITLFFP